MKKIVSLLILLFIFNIAVQAQSKDEQAVEAAVETLKNALISGDKTELENIAADELTYGHSSGKLEDKSAFVEALTSKVSDFKTIDLTNQTIKVVGNTALVRHELKADVVDSGKPASIHLGVLLVWQKEKGKWNLLARQAYKM